MSRSAFTLKVFSVYMLAFGTSLIVIPNLMLSVFGMPQTTEVWIRVVGVLAIVIGVYQWYAAKSEARAVFQASVYARAFVFLAFIAFVLLGFVKPVLILFGGIDLAGGIWTYMALRSES